jgi:hypothetical protein
VAVIGAILEKVSAGLDVAVSSRALRAEQQSVLMGVLQTLRGDQSCLTAKEKPPASCEAEGDLARVKITSY